MALPKRNADIPPGDPRPFGEVSFNYTNHDGLFVIGEEPWRFETQWSTAGQAAAHLYNDPPTIRGVAIAHRVSSIAAVTPDVVGQSDFTSRTRTPRVGQVALIENANEFFAALELLEVRSMEDPADSLMRYRYAI